MDNIEDFAEERYRDVERACKFLLKFLENADKPTPEQFREAIDEILELMREVVNRAVDVDSDYRYEVRDLEAELKQYRG